MKLSISGRVGRHIRANVVGYIALFCFAIGGVAEALPGRNTVDSGDIKQRQVRTVDLANAAVKPTKIAPGAVSSPAVAADALTGSDIDESTLALPAGSIGPAEEENQIRRIVIPAHAIDPAYLAQAPARTPLGGPAGALSFDPATEEAVLLTLQVPIDRVPGTSILIDLYWSPSVAASLDQRVRWDGTYVAAGAGEDATPGVAVGLTAREAPGLSEDVVVPTSFTGDLLTGLDNGDLLFLRLFRDADNVDDDHPGDAQLHAVAFRYTSVD